MDYREYLPSPRLAPVVRCFWTLEGHACQLADAAQPVLPDGHPECVVHLGDPFERVAQDRLAVRQPSILFAGQLTAQLVLRPTGRIAVVGIRLHADGAPTLVSAPQDRLAGLTIPVADVSASLGIELAGVRDSTDSPAAALTMIQDRLSSLVRAQRIDPRVRSVVASIRRRHGRVSIDAEAARIGMTRRHLERRFAELVGMPPKRFARIARFQHALALLERPAGGDASRPGTSAAVESGYADQAHFIRDFRDLAGCPPGAHLMRRGELTGLFLEQRYHAIG